MNHRQADHPCARLGLLVGGLTLALTLVGALAGCGGAGATTGNSAWPYQATYGACDPGVRAKLHVTTNGIATLHSAAPSVFISAHNVSLSIDNLRADGALYALNAGNGTLRWCVSFSHAPIPGPANATGFVSEPAPPISLPSRPTVANGLVYVGTENGGVFAFDAASGALRWNHQLHDLDLVQPTYANGTLYLAGGGDVYALDARTGATRWQSAVAQSEIGAPIVVTGGLAYASSIGAAVYAIDTTTGALRWTFATHGRVYQPPVVAEGMVYFGAGEGDGHFYAVDALTGKLRWSYASGYIINNAPTVANGVVYVCNDANLPSLFAFDGATGALRWRYPFTAIGAGSTPVIEQGVVYLTGIGALALDAQSHRLLWANSLNSTQSQIESAPILWTGALYMTRYDGMTASNDALITLDASTGAIRWSVALVGDPIGPALG